jgi:hypothetical protein
LLLAALALLVPLFVPVATILAAAFALLVIAAIAESRAAARRSRYHHDSHSNDVAPAVATRHPPALAGDRRAALANSECD